MFLAVILSIEETPTPALDGNLTSTFTGAIGIIATKRVIFLVSSHLLLIIVAFVGGYHHTNFDTIRCTDGLHNVDSTHHIGLVSINWDFITKAHQRLSSKMEDNLRLILSKDFFHLLTITNISTDVCSNLFANSRENKVIFLRIGFKAYTNHLCTQLMEPDGEPTALETGVTSYKDAFAIIKVIENIYHTI